MSVFIWPHIYARHHRTSISSIRSWTSTDSSCWGRICWRLRRLWFGVEWTSSVIMPSIWSFPVRHTQIDMACFTSRCCCFHRKPRATGSYWVYLKVDLHYLYRLLGAYIRLSERKLPQRASVAVHNEKSCDVYVFYASSHLWGRILSWAF